MLDHPCDQLKWSCLWIPYTKYWKEWHQLENAVEFMPLFWSKPSMTLIRRYIWQVPGNSIRKLRWPLSSWELECQEVWDSVKVYPCTCCGPIRLQLYLCIVTWLLIIADEANASFMSFESRWINPTSFLFCLIGKGGESWSVEWINSLFIHFIIDGSRDRCIRVW